MLSNFAAALAGGLGGYRDQTEMLDPTIEDDNSFLSVDVTGGSSHKVSETLRCVHVCLFIGAFKIQDVGRLGFHLKLRIIVFDVNNNFLISLSLEYLFQLIFNSAT